MEGTRSTRGGGGKGRRRCIKPGIKGYISFTIGLPSRLNLSENPAYCNHELKATFARDLEA